MVALGLITTTVLAAVAGLLFMANGLSLARRRPPVALPLRAFAAAWMGLGVMFWTSAAQAGLGLMAEPSVAVYWVLVWLRVIAGGVAIGGFGAYIVFAWTGSAKWASLAPAAALLHVVFWLGFVNGYTVAGLYVGQWTVRPDYAPGVLLVGGVVGAIVAFFLPLAELLVAYLVFWPSAETPAQRFRLVAVTIALLLFLGSVALQVSPDADPDSRWLAINPWVMLASGALARLAFRPTTWMRSRYGLETYPD